jgi:hypothetical protein
MDSDQALKERSQVSSDRELFAVEYDRVVGRKWAPGVRERNVGGTMINMVILELTPD